MEYSISKLDKRKGLKIPTKINNNLAYLIGVLAGDGSIGFRENKSEYSVKLVGNPKDEREYYQLVIGPKFEEVFGIRPNLKLFDGKTTYGFRIFSKNLVQYLTKCVGLPLGPKYKINIPKLIINNQEYIVSFLQGLFDTDGSICFKKRAKSYPYYPVIALSSKSKKLIIEVSKILSDLGIKTVTTLDYNLKDKRMKPGHTVINRIELNGQKNLILFIDKIGFLSPKHNNKIRIWKKSSGGRI